MTPYPGWQFIFDHTGAVHHVPEFQTLRLMCEAIAEARKTCGCGGMNCVGAKHLKELLSKIPE